MSILKKTNAPYLVSGALAIGTLLASGVFAVAPYIGFLAPVAALSVGLPFIIGGAIFSVAAIALSAVVISKNNTISEKNARLGGKDTQISSLENQLAEYETFHNAVDVQKEQEKRQEKFENRVAARKKEEANEMAELKAKGLLPDIIALSDTETETPSPKSQPTKEEKSQSMGTLGKVTAEAARGAATGAGVGAVIGAATGAVIGGVGAGVVALKDVDYDNCTKSNTPTKFNEVKASPVSNGACLGPQM